MSRSLIIGIISTLILISILASVFYYSYIKEKEKPLFDAIPNNAALVIEVKNISLNWQKLQHSEMWESLANNEVVQTFSSQITRLDSILALNPLFNEMISSKKVAVSFHKSNHIGILVVAQAVQDANLPEAIQQLCIQQDLVLQRHNFEKVKVYDIKSKNGELICSVALKDHLLICSTDGSLMEESIMKLTYKLVNPVRRLENLTTLARNGSEFNLYINYHTLPALLSDFLKTEHTLLFHYLQRFANWSILNLEFQKEYISMKGVTVTDDSLFQYLDLFNNQSPVISKMDKYIPSNLAYKIQMGFSDYPAFKNDLTEYLQQINKYEPYVKHKDSIESLYDIDLDNSFENIIGEEVLVGSLESGSEDLNKNSFAMIRLRDLNFASGLLEQLARKGNLRNNYTDTNAVSIAKNKLPFGSFLMYYFGGPFEHITSPFYTFIDDILVLANDENVLNKLVSNHQSKNTLSENPAYPSFVQTIGESYNLSLFIQTAMAIQLPSAFVHETFYSQLNRYGNDYKKFEFIQVQYASSSNKSFYTQIHYRYNSKREEETKLLWQTKLDTGIAIKPAIVPLSISRQNGILVQDYSHSLYLVSDQGNILWKTKLSGKIVSEFYVTDPDKNGNFHYLFNTATQTYLLDNKGVNHTGYPVRFPGKTDFGLLLIDIFGDSSFTWYVTLTNNRIAGYGLDGRPLRGWNPKTHPIALTSGMQYIVSGTQHLLGTTDKTGLLILFNEKGERQKADSIYVKPGSAAFMYAADTATTVVSGIDSTGNLFRMQLHANLHTDGYTRYNNYINKLIQPLYYAPTSELYTLVSDSFGYSLIHPNDGVLFEKTEIDTLFIPPYATITYDGKFMIAQINKKRNEISWFDTKGLSYPSFPLKGNSYFTVGMVLNNGTKNLITSDMNNYLLLYRLK